MSKSPWIGAALAAVLLLSACDGIGRTAAQHASTRVPVGHSTQTLHVDGHDRTVHVYRPGTVDGRSATPLVLVLHGGFGSGTQAESAYGWDTEADRGGFVVAFPDGLDRAWNAGGGCCGKPGTDGVDDVRFLTTVVSAIEGELPIDHRRVYVAGMSNGALMSYRLACDTDVFAAIAPVSGTLLGDCDSPHPVSIIHIHGTADTRVRYLGGRGEGVAHINGPPVPDLVAGWRGIDRCAEPTTAKAPPVTTSTATCPGGRAVELVTVDGAGHQWPGSSEHVLRDKLLGSDPPSTALDATDVIWQFFAAHPKPSS